MLERGKRSTGTYVILRPQEHEVQVVGAIEDHEIRDRKVEVK